MSQDAALGTVTMTNLRRNYFLQMSVNVTTDQTPSQTSDRAAVASNQSSTATAPQCDHPVISDRSFFVSPSSTIEGRGGRGRLAQRLTEVLHMERRQMALALSLSLDLFLMKGNLFIAVRAQARDRQTDRDRESDRTSRREVEEKKTKRKGGQNRGMWLTV